MTHIWYKGTSHGYTSAVTKVKVICKGQGRISQKLLFLVFNMPQHFEDTCWLGSLPFCQTTNFRLFQAEKYADVNFDFNKKRQKVLQQSEKHTKKGRNCLLQLITPFLSGH